MKSEIKIGALAPWFGCKRTLASKIIAEFGPHDCYWEPMCGSCAVLMAKEPVQAETVCDLHGGITCVARTLADPRAALDVYRRLAGVIACEEYWRECVINCTDSSPDPDYPDPIWASDYIVASWLARNGMAGTDSAMTSFATRFSATGGSTACRWRSVVDSIPAWHQRLRNVTILNRDCFEVIERIDDANGTVIYVDPPYVAEGGRYDHAFAGIDHERLSDALKRFRRARVLVSYYADPLISTLYDGWHCLTLDTPKFLAKAGQRDATGDCPTAPEILLINHPRIEDGMSLYGD